MQLLVASTTKLCSRNTIKCINLLRMIHYDGWYHEPVSPKTPIKSDTTAVILGWAGANRDHVQKYTQLYSNEFGIGAHGYILPMENVFSYDQDSQEQAAHAVIDAIARDNTGQKVVIHCFSNNGFNLYRHVSTLLKSSKHPHRYVLY
jgi:hypothetical protein